ncbi:MAG: sulfatase [Actinomycetota bacterium]
MRSRNTALLGAAAAVLVAGVMSFPPAVGAQLARVSDQRVRADDGPPNVLIIVTDDQRDGLQVMPATRRYFEDRGVKFDNAYVTTPLCCPSRASIFTGRYAHNTGVHTEADASKLDQQTTLQYYLQQAGYETAMFGKYLNSWARADAPPFFNQWAFFKKSGSSYKEGRWNVDGQVKTVDRYSTSYIDHKATKFLRAENARDTTKPWFMYLATSAPHRPFTAQRKYKNAGVPRWNPDPAVFEHDRTDKPDYVQSQYSTPQAGRLVRKKQFRTLMSVDDLVKDVFKTMNRTNDTSNTIAFLISDNGFLWGEHGLTRKTTPYTPSVQVPMLMRWPGHVSPSTTDDRMVANIDIAPTVVAATGIDPGNAAMDGRSLLDTSAMRTRLLLEYYTDSTLVKPGHFPTPSWASTRTTDYEYIEYYGPDGVTPTLEEYYDLRTDPYELDNLLGDADTSNDPDQATLTQLREQVNLDRMCSGTSGPTACP